MTNNVSQDIKMHDPIDICTLNVDDLKSVISKVDSYFGDVLFKHNIDGKRLNELDYYTFLVETNTSENKISLNLWNTVVNKFNLNQDGILFKQKDRKDISITGVTTTQVHQDKWCNTNNHKYDELPFYGRIIYPNELTSDRYKEIISLTNYSKFEKLLPYEKYKIELNKYQISTLFDISKIAVITGKIPGFKLEDFNDLVEDVYKIFPKQLLNSNDNVVDSKETGFVFRRSNALDTSKYELNEPYFVRLDECSPKDSIHGCGPISNIYTIFQSIICSARCLKSLNWCNFSNIGTYLWLIKWRNDINIGNEFRCFIRNKQLNAISQYNWYKPNGWYYNKNVLKNIARKVETISLQFCEYLNLNEFVIDIHVKYDNNSSNNNDSDVSTTKDDHIIVEVIELNAYGAMCAAGACCYHWIRDFKQLYGIHDKSDIIEIRVVINDDDPDIISLINPSQYIPLFKPFDSF